MIRPGFKTGPKTWDEGKKIVEEYGAKLAEIWFDARKIDEYREPLQWFLDHGVQLGLHYWGIIQPPTHYSLQTTNSFKPNLATHHNNVRGETIQQIKDTIDYAASINAMYVNAHPGAALLEQIDFTIGKQSLVPNQEPTPPEQATELLLKTAQELNDYAKQKAVLLTIETLPGREAYTHGTREPLYDSQNVSLDIIAELGSLGIALANDITHTASFIAAEFLSSLPRSSGEIKRGYYREIGSQSDKTNSINLEELWTATLDYSRRIAPHTRLIHVNTMTPPFNGTDSHDGVTEADFANNVFPNKQQLLEWLALYGAVDDILHSPRHGEASGDTKPTNKQELQTTHYRVLLKPCAKGDKLLTTFAIPEPNSNMAENYLALKTLIERYL